MILEEKLQGVEKAIEGFYEAKQIAPRLVESILYSVHAGGKRIRPLLLLELLEAFHAPILEAHFQVAAALEMIHTGSLIHDDLPAMDNDDYRRGNLTNHKVYGDGMAILAGDGLLTYAFQLCSENTTASAEQKIKAIQCLATAAGPEGMVGGQAFDLLSEGKHIPLEELKVLHSGKTGALFNAAIELGLILSNADLAKYAAYMTYANCLGLLFQITDDILDVTGTIEELGKTPGSDIRQDKSTYVSLLGLDEARNEAHVVAQKAHAALATIEDDTHILSAIIDYLMDRTH